MYAEFTENDIIELGSLNCDFASSESEDEQLLYEDLNQNALQQNTKMSKIYEVALLLRSSMQETAPFPRAWPPPTADICNETAKDITPIPLYNFLAWVMNKSNEPTLDNFVPLETSEDRKVIAVAQDIIYIIQVADES